MFNPFLANIPISYTLKAPQNLRFSVVFRGHQMGTLARNELICEQNEALVTSLTTGNMKERETDTGNQNHMNLDSNIAMENDNFSQEGPNISHRMDVRLNHFRQTNTNEIHILDRFAKPNSIRPVTKVL